MTQYYGDITQSGTPNAADANIILQISREQINWNTWNPGIENGKHIINAVAQTCPPDQPVKVDAATANLVLQIARQQVNPVEFLCNLTPEDKLWVSFTGNDHYSEWYEMETDELEGFTKFKISATAHPEVGTELQTWASDKTTNLQGILMTASPTRPSASTLTEDQRAKTFNSDLLKFNCDGTYNADHGVNTNQVNLRVKAFNNQAKRNVQRHVLVLHSGTDGSAHCCSAFVSGTASWNGWCSLSGSNTRFLRSIGQLNDLICVAIVFITPVAALRMGLSGARSLARTATSDVKWPMTFFICSSVLVSSAFAVVVESSAEESTENWS